jgi:hypothetical protein
MAAPLLALVWQYRCEDLPGVETEPGTRRNNCDPEVNHRGTRPAVTVLTPCFPVSRDGDCPIFGLISDHDFQTRTTGPHPR